MSERSGDGESRGKTPSGPSTRSVHGGERQHRDSHAVTTPIHQTSTFWFEGSQEVIDYNEGRNPRDEYGRYGNPTWRAVERKLSELEGAEESVLFASGMCAATTTFLALLPAGSHLVVTSDCYRRTRQFIQEYLGRMGVETTVIEPSDTQKLAATLRDDTAVFFTESPTNPYLRVIDVEQAVAVAHERDVKVVIDTTFASPVNHRPLEQGADLVLHSATKYLGGHNDLLAGTVSGSSEIIGPIRNAVGVLGGVIDSHAAWLLLRGLKTLALRMERHNANGQALAEWLEGHAKVRRVVYPGLPSHPDYEAAKRQMQGFGGVVTFELDTDLEGAKRFIDSLELPYQAPSLGGVESLVELPITMSYWDIPPAERLAMGITDSLVRFSTGVEDIEDLLRDIGQALDRV
ncbi:MAG: aminotransferase class I/II-fold pyridoxal phosphate-dependent enzyme [Myxococcota bacterium]|nr:aminotransferase class I/II-fold pyridoxal phosphate-dependent enzyme [Myxococcota bacterium]